jgi:hypothetical protein
MGQKSVLSYELAKTYVRHWSGLKNFPFHPEGELALVECLMNFCVSVDHARDVRSRFKDVCPTPGELEDCCVGTKTHFLPPEPSFKEKWLAEGATFDPEWSRQVQSQLNRQDETAHDRRAREWKAILAEARKAKPERRSLPNWKLAASLTDREVARITKQLGFELTPWDKQNLEE